MGGRWKLKFRELIFPANDACKTGCKYGILVSSLIKNINNAES